MYMRTTLTIAVLAVPHLLKAINAADGIRKLAIRNAHEAYERAETGNKRIDITSKLPSIAREK